MTYQRDPDERLTTGQRTSVREEENSWGVFPAVLGVVFLLLVGLIAYNMYNSSTTGPASVSPSAQAPSATPPAVIPPATTIPETPPPTKTP